MKRLACFAALLLLMLPAIVNAQNVIITGNVKSASGGESLGSVSVTLKGNSNGTFTDNKGNFRLSLPSKTKSPVTVLFSSIGFAQHSIPKVLEKLNAKSVPYMKVNELQAKNNFIL